MTKNKVDVLSLFEKAKNEGTFLKVCAPMVRYSKLQFRNLVKRNGVDLCFSPMILADSFCRSSKARLNEFSTSTIDNPIVVQFAAKTVHDFVGASELVYPYADGVDLNCGCPQRWAMKDGYGCSLLNEPDIIHSLVRNFKSNLPASFSLSVKIRLLKELKDTIELCRRLENSGIDFLTVHGRKPWQKSSEPVDKLALKEIKSSLRIPVIANGNVKYLDDAENLYEETKCDGIMSAQGLLTNPSLFTGATVTPMSCVQDWLNISFNQKLMTFQCFHHHLVFMLEKILSKKQKQVFNYLPTHGDVYEFLEETYGIKPMTLSDQLGEDIQCDYKSVDYSVLKTIYSDNSLTDSEKHKSLNDNYNSALSDGKYFNNVVCQEYCDLDNMESSMFDEN